MPGTITASLPVSRPSMRLTDYQLSGIVTALDSNHDGELSNDEVHFSLSARGRLQDGSMSVSAVAAALRDEKVALRQLPTGVATQVAMLLSGQMYANGVLPTSLDTDHSGSLSTAELATAISKGQLVINRSVRATTDAPGREEHFAVRATLPVGDIVQSQEQSQAKLIRGDGSAALQAAVRGLMATAAAGGSTGLAANAIYQGIAALGSLPQYAGQPGWLTMIGRFGMAAMTRGETSVESILAAAGRQIMYDRPDEEGVRVFYTAALKAVQTQMAVDADRWDSVLLRQLDTESSALTLMRGAFAGSSRSSDGTGPESLN